jgi:hypothetical protein
MTMVIKALIVNHTARDLVTDCNANSGKLQGLFHRSVKKPVYFPALYAAQLLKR